MSDFTQVQNLADVDFVNTSVEDLLSAAVTAYQDKYYELKGETVTVQPGDDVYILLYAEALRQYSILQNINVAARMNLLKYATGDYLDQLAANTGNVRSEAEAAVTAITFTLGAIQAQPITIPQGTRVTAGDGIYFQTDEVAIIPIGNTAVIGVSATCTTTGASGNGYIPGQLNILVDSVPYVASVTNTETTEGGSDLESDLSLAEKIFASPSGYSVAGPSSAYDYFSRAYSSAIIDTAVISPSAGTIDVYVLLTGGALPNETFLNELEAYLAGYRPLTDNLNVLAPTVTNYNIVFTYFIDSSNAGQATTIQSAVTAAINDFITWTQSKIGRDIIPDQLTARIISAGAKRVAITSPPAYTTVISTSIAIAQTITATYGGIDA